MKIKRREFLHKSAIVVAGVSAAATGVTAAGLAAEWTARLKTLTAHEGETLLKMARQIFPHDRLDDSYYMKVVEDLDIEASRKPVTGKMLRAGVANLDLSAKGKFAARPAAEQVSALEKIQRTPFFEKVRSAEMVALYNNPDVWKVFGYQGASYPFGGYLHHGFNDLNWLPDPPAAASPKSG
ncbi:MAG TPA: hypothetical protein VL393_05335 [Candidatus Binataceae bacterium]|nr:hypothetical protein [Candidatus Binataceae bacterium]